MDATRAARAADGPVAGGDPVEGPGRSLVAACLRGDRGAWEALVHAHNRLVYTTLRRHGAGADEAADLFQEVWLVAWANLAYLRDERGLTAWLATIAARTAMRTIRRRARWPVLTGAPYEARARDVRDRGATPDEVVLEREQAAAVRAAVATLSERDRRLVELFFYDPTAPSYAEIAAQLGVSPDSVGALRMRCLRRLRAALERASGMTGTADPRPHGA